ncbi:MAG: MoxR family ATPase [Xanthomonadales bacterium]|nr:MoxR family ATPase [Gammaproteobacteria bacterium]MBT8052704.1 MoxR family ATPase [Gammaproteobacteria bacterium]NND57366.1 MoxR family ATPase [Xanthomonadales bacterium]NNK50638.1 MoxR family ATPase [Xanthomonadales bacterium]
MNSTVIASERGTEGRHERLLEARSAVNSILLGKDMQVGLAFCCLLARGHLLIEDVPGVGKTTLAHAMARVIGSDYQRIQFTSDLLPADILGVSIYKREKDEFEFHPGPIFSQVILADEVNRATPKTQSALLEGMAEGQVTIENETHVLPSPFFVMATQNPLDLVGTYPLPDSQLDRFLLSFSLGYPDPAAERELLVTEDRARLLDRTSALLDPQDIKALQADCESIHVSENLLDYIQELLRETRDDRWFETGLSPRAGLALLRASRALAFLENRDFVIPEDIKNVFPALSRHRLSPTSGFSQSPEEQISELLSQVPIP